MGARIGVGVEIGAKTRAGARTGTRAVFWSVICRTLFVITGMKSPIVCPFMAFTFMLKVPILSIRCVVWDIIIINKTTNSIVIFL